MSEVASICVMQPCQDNPIINNNYLCTLNEESARGIFKCDLCQISATSYKVLMKHYEGRKHKIRTEREGKTFFCELCELTANSQKQLENHLNSSRHKSNLLKKEYKMNGGGKVNGTLGAWIILVGIVCLFINFLLLFRVCL